MKKSILQRSVIFFTTATVTLTGCGYDDINLQSTADEQLTMASSQRKMIDHAKEKDFFKEAFAYSLMEAMNNSLDLRVIIKNEVLKMFNKDYEVLVYKIKDLSLENGKNFESLIDEGLKKHNITLKDVLQAEPTLTILVPELPVNSFSAKQWDAEAEIPAVAIRTNLTNEVPMISPDLKKGIIPSDAIPGFPVVVVKNNERLVSNLDYRDIDKLDTKPVYEGDGIIIKFWSDAFDNRLNSNKFSQRLTSYMDSELVDAYNIYKGTDGWQRDYIYYGIQPSSPNGAFKYNFKEHIRSFAMEGSAQKAYDKISDQTGDPFMNDHHRISSSHWTGGFYEFKVKTLINAKNGVGDELVNGFTVSPQDLFDLEYEVYSTGWWFWKKRYYRLKKVTNKTVNINLPIINWDLDQYATSLKVEIEEVDLNTTTVITETRSVKFATNFGIDVSLGEKVKIGAKFGTSQESNQSASVQKTFTQGNDALGTSIINFADNVIIGKVNTFFSDKWKTRSYSTGYCYFSMEPVKVQ